MARTNHLDRDARRTERATVARSRDRAARMADAETERAEMRAEEYAAELARYERATFRTVNPETGDVFHYSPNFLGTDIPNPAIVALRRATFRGRAIVAEIAEGADWQDWSETE